VFQKSFSIAVLASLGVILGAAYMLWLYRRVVFGKLTDPTLKKMPDLNRTEIYIFFSLGSLILFFGFYPEPLLNTIEVSIDNLINNYQLKLDFHLNNITK
jgi:NADH-quinone oxidoreductase subunit M